MLRKYFYPYLEGALSELTSGVQSMGIHPFHLTLLGLGLSLLGAMAYGRGFFFFCAMFVLTAGLCDMMDGMLARRTGQATEFGAFIDSVIDRYSDFLFLFGIMVHYLYLHASGTVILTLVVLLGAFLTSYTKARMECFSVTCDTGMIERSERLMLIFIGSFLHLMVPVLWILAILSHITALQRITLAQEKLTRD